MNDPDQLFEGMDVYDVDGKKIGKVVRYDARLGYFETEGTFSGPRFIPFWAIEKIGPGGTYLNVPKDIVSDIYRHTPTVQPGLTPDGRLTGTGTLRSGWTGQTVPLDAEGLELVKEHIHIGASVFDAAHENLGTIQDYDPATGYMRIEKARFTVKDVFLPATSISYLDEEGIHLSELKDNILNRFSRVPDVARQFFAR